MQAQSLCDRTRETRYVAAGALVGGVLGVALYEWIRTDLLGNIRLSDLQGNVCALTLALTCGGGGAYLVRKYRTPTGPGPGPGPGPRLSEKRFGVTRVFFENADITTRNVDAIVNAANSGMLGGSGIDGAIHTACGPGLRVECAKHPVGLGGRCPTGEARITATGADADHPVPFGWVVHAVGPRRGTPNQQQLLTSAYRNALEQAATKPGIRTIAFPSISTGIFSYPIDEAAPIAIGAIKQYLEANPRRFDEIRFCFYGNVSHRAWFERALAAASEEA